MRKARIGMLFAACAAVMVPLGAACAADAPAVQARIHVDRQHQPVSRYEYGMFIEPIGSLVARSLWAEMLDDRKFYFPVVDAAHDPVQPARADGPPLPPLRKWRPI